MFRREDDTERVFVSGAAGDDDVVGEGFRWLASYAGKHRHERAAIVLPGVKNAEYLERIIGAGPARRLRKDRELGLGGLTLEMYTEVKPPSAYEGPILAVWTRDKSLDKLDTTGAAAICAAPWNPDNIADWKANWNPIDVRTGQAAGSDTTVSNPVVSKGLEHLTDRVNLGTGLTHPSDRSSAIQLFQLFVQGGEAYIADEIRAWAVRQGWQPEDARELAEVADKVQQGRKLKSESGRQWRDDYLERLRREVTES